ncbi:MAG TPA: ribosomal protein S18-alanine N-acetyltransferase [Gemmatimonadales bacterium]|nr:ribosomal protein S18-alanine N-acetyltransferase [Gemmatimonadales bacterium]
MTADPPRRKRAGRLATDVPCRIRPAQEADLAALVAIERIAFTDPWSRSDFADCLRLGWPIFVAENGGSALGYIVGRAVVDQGEVLNLGVLLAARRRGVGTALVRRLLDDFARRGVVSAFLEVRESNLPAQQLYESFGFTAVGRRARYYQRPMEDAVVLRAAISADTASA